MNSESAEKLAAQRLIERCASQVSTSLPGELWKLEPAITTAFARFGSTCANEALEKAAQIIDQWQPSTMGRDATAAAIRRLKAEAE
jgi:hypothetical protein